MTWATLIANQVFVENIKNAQPCKLLARLLHEMNGENTSKNKLIEVVFMTLTIGGFCGTTIDVIECDKDT